MATTDGAPDTPTATHDPMAGRVSRWADLRRTGIPIQFIDSILPGGLRMNYSVIGDTASENPDYAPTITAPHKFGIGMYEAPPGNGPRWHTHEYVELFMPLTGRWKYSYGTNEADPDDVLGEVELGVWDIISFPPGLWRRFENISEENAIGFAVLDPHEPFAGRDPIWPKWLVDQAAERGLAADASGRMVKPADFSALEEEVAAKIRGGAA